MCNTRRVTEIAGTGTIGDFKHGALLRGAASAFDLRGNTQRLYRSAPSPRIADRRALLNDMRVVREDARAAARAVNE